MRGNFTKNRYERYLAKNDFVISIFSNAKNKKRRPVWWIGRVKREREREREGN